MSSAAKDRTLGDLSPCLQVKFIISSLLDVVDRHTCSVCIISVVRVILIWRVIESGNTDVTWNAAATANWNTFEVNIAIICACLTTIKPAVTRMFPNLLASGPASAPLSKGIDVAGGRRQRVGGWEPGLIDTNGSSDLVEHQWHGMVETKAGRQ